MQVGDGAVESRNDDVAGPSTGGAGSTPTVRRRRQGASDLIESPIDRPSSANNRANDSSISSVAVTLIFQPHFPIYILVNFNLFTITF